ncbi:nucleotidyltransferase [Marinigracilibium pacificum]|uniref:Nucleotidyltransferase n=1 Tax=Marinigracilibium pacificum TaxID=2729599 RepID=A0A848J4A6_9BACT|nr:nucleotidyltransferase [Marinigracilibium pacificum]NMM50335.1 hypothetical protein [Marinigracilibium pacificum]
MKKIPNNTFPEHFKDFILCLNRNKVEYLLIGGYAMGAYGHIRGTGDLDIFLNATQENSKKMINACIDYGISEDSLSDEMFQVPKMVGIGTPPLRIEILKHLNSVDFRYAYQRCIKKKVDGVDINVVSLDDLILLKKAARRDRNLSRDKEDLTFLEKLKKYMEKNKNGGMNL